jgi:hypothetical protein
MKLSLVLLIIFMVAACAPQQTTQIPNPIVATSEPASTSSAIASSTSIAACVCPTGIVSPSQSQGEVNNFPPVICNCPAILITPEVEVTETESSPQNIPTSGITLADNGKTFILHPGEGFLLNLGIDTFDWAVDIDHQNVLSRVMNVMVPRGAQGIYQAVSLGQAVLTAVGDPLCRKSVPACGAPSILFRITVIVQ